MRDKRHQSRSALAISSGPLSQRRKLGAPYSTTSRSSSLMRSSAVQLRADAHGERLAGVLVDDVRELQSVVGRWSRRTRSRSPTRDSVAAHAAVRSCRAGHARRLRLCGAAVSGPRRATDAAPACGSRASPPGARPAWPSCNPTADGLRRSHAAGAATRRRRSGAADAVCVASSGADPRPDTHRSETPKRSCKRRTARRRRSGVRSFPQPTP